jgi:hypothetical protein
MANELKAKDVSTNSIRLYNTVYAAMCTSNSYSLHMPTQLLR